MITVIEFIERNHEGLRERLGEIEGEGGQREGLRYVLYLCVSW